MAVVQEIADATGRALAQKYDDAIAEAAGGWAVLSDDLIRRMVRQIYPDGIEVITLDGKPLIRFWPVEVAHGEGDNHYRMVASRRYQVL